MHLSRRVIDEWSLYRVNDPVYRLPPKETLSGSSLPKPDPQWLILRPLAHPLVEGRFKEASLCLKSNKCPP